MTGKNGSYKIQARVSKLDVLCPVVALGPFGNGAKKNSGKIRDGPLNGRARVAASVIVREHTNNHAFSNFAAKMRANLKGRL